MYKKLILLISVLVLSSASTSQALVVGDFEDGLDGWAPAGDATLTLSTIGATSGTGSLLIEGGGSWQMLALLDIKAIRSVLAVDGAAISADVTAFAEDMQTDWMNMEMIINGQNHDDTGAHNNIGWQSLGGLDIVRDGVTQTLYWELPADLSAKIAGTDDNIEWFELFIVTNNGATNTKIYIDNIQLIGAELEPPPAGPTIAWVSYHAADDEPHADAAAVGFTQAPDIGYTDLLKANGYNVVRVLTSQTPDVEFLNTMDLVIISRTASSGHYSGSGATLWNSVTAPMINLNGYTLRSSRLGFTDGTDMPDTTGDIRLAVTDPTHPIFDGIALTDGVMDNLYAQGAVPLPTDGTPSRGISINNNTPDDDGTVLATIAEVSADTGPVGGMVIAEWPAGAIMEHSSGSPTDVLGGPRLVFLTGSREPDGVTGGQAAALYDLYPDGEKMFLNAVKYMIPVIPVDPGTANLVHSWTFDDGTANDIVGSANGTLVGDATVVDGQLVLDGNGDWMDMPGDVIAMNTFEGLTIEIKFTSIAGANTGFHMVTAFGEEGTGANPGYGYKYVCITPARGDNVSRAMIQTVSMDNDPWSEETGVSDVIEHDDGLPHHMVCTIDNTELAFYIDGVLIGTAALDPPGNSIAGIGTDAAHIGKGVYGVDPLWAGSVDYLNLYNRALSEGEVRYLAGERVQVSVENFSFELPGTEKIKGWNGEGVAGTPAVDIPGWSSDSEVGDSGVESDWPGSTEGVWAGFLMGSDPSVWNLTDHVIGSGEEFVLLVDLQDNWTDGGAPEVLISLYYDDAGTRVTVASDIVTPLDQAEGGWSEFLLSFSADDVPDSAGKLLGIEIDNVSATDSWIGMDNVRLLLN